MLITFAIGARRQNGFADQSVAAVSLRRSTRDSHLTVHRGPGWRQLHILANGMVGVPGNPDPLSAGKPLRDGIRIGPFWLISASFVVGGAQAPRSASLLELSQNGRDQNAYLFLTEP